MKILYCRRCKADVPMLDEDEWQEVKPALNSATEGVKQYRREHGVTLSEVPVNEFFRPALDVYERMTGHRETNHEVLWHHYLALYGPPCHACGRPLRTPQARLCGTCMAPRESG